MSSALTGLSQALRGGAERATGRLNTIQKAHIAAQRFADLGTEDANSFAEQMRNNPAVAYAAATDFGGLGKLYEEMKRQAAFERAKSAALGAAAGPADQPGVRPANDIGQDRLATTSEIFMKGLPAIQTPEGFEMFNQMASQLGFTLPPWVQSVPFSRYTEESQKRFWDHASTTGDFFGARKLLEVDPRIGAPQGQRFTADGQRLEDIPGARVANPEMQQVDQWQMNIQRANDIADREGWKTAGDVAKAISKGVIAPITAAQVDAVNDARSTQVNPFTFGTGAPASIGGLTLHPAVEAYVNQIRAARK